MALCRRYEVGSCGRCCAVLSLGWRFERFGVALRVSGRAFSGRDFVRTRGRNRPFEGVCRGGVGEACVEHFFMPPIHLECGCQIVGRKSIDL